MGLLAAGVLALSVVGYLVLREPDADPERDRARIDALLASEELLLNWTVELRHLDKAALDLAIPGERGAPLFAERVSVGALAPRAEARLVAEGSGASPTLREWKTDTGDRTVPLADLELWQPLLREVEYFDHAHFAFVDVDPLSPQDDRWGAEIAFDGLARMRAGGWRAVRARLRFVFLRERDSLTDAASWRIGEWRTEKLATLELDGLLFEDHLDRAVPDLAVLERAERSVHEELVAEMIFDYAKPESERTFEPPHRYFRPQPQDPHPAVSVVDVDDDGFDDFYVSMMWGPNLLFENRRDGTFVETAAERGIDVQDHSAASLFADFDNDGDPDLFVGRRMGRSRYFSNEGGRFVDRTREWIGTPLPGLVSSISAADYDGDGLLDVLFSTYASATFKMDVDRLHELSHLGAERALQERPLLGAFLTPEESRELGEIYLSPEFGYHPFYNQCGPPNVLLRNIGDGRFVVASEVEELRLFRHTYQATWSDYDADGDPDLYVANDFAPNNLFRNEGGRFVDVTEETGTADVGFGMGVTWGDYDADGDFDLYVTNMYSKAGLRITKKVPGLDPVFASLSRGNSLFANEGDRFVKVSGLDDGDVHVEKSGWAWGAQFVDVDNDRWLDLYSLNGYYTAPSEVRAQVDL